MIGRLEKPVIDCPDPRELAQFYAAVLGMVVVEDGAAWVVLGREPGRRELAFQRAAGPTAATWPAGDRPIQLHLDIRVADIDAAEHAVLDLGARRLPSAHENGFRVYTDPAGNPFCLVFG